MTNSDITIIMPGGHCIEWKWFEFIKHFLIVQNLPNKGLTWAVKLECFEVCVKSFFSSENEMTLFIHPLRLHLAMCNFKVALNNAEVMPAQSYCRVCFIVCFFWCFPFNKLFRNYWHNDFFSSGLCSVAATLYVSLPCLWNVMQYNISKNLTDHCKSSLQVITLYGERLGLNKPKLHNKYTKLTDTKLK